MHIIKTNGAWLLCKFLCSQTLVHWRDTIILKSQDPWMRGSVIFVYGLNENSYLNGDVITNWICCSVL